MVYFNGDYTVCSLEETIDCHNITKCTSKMEIEGKVSMGEKEKQIFHSMYEKARYGKESCTKEEAAAYRF